MAIYHCSVKIIGRSSGRSAVAAAAYRAGQKITNERDGLTHDYSRKSGVAHSEIMLPTHAPTEWTDRATLWNAVEKIERRQDAQTAREVEVALPVEFSIDENVQTVQNYIHENFTSRGMCADYSIHYPKGNPHAHIMLTMRDVSPDGFGNKNRDWNKVQLLEEWRENWAEVCNRTLEKKGLQKIDHRSLEDQGLERIPTIHVWRSAEREIINQRIIQFNEQFTPQNVSLYMNELNEGYTIAKGFANEHGQGERELARIEDSIKTISKRRDDLLVQYRNLEQAKVERDGMGILKNKREIDARIERLESAYKHSWDYFERSYKVAPDQVQNEIRRLENDYVNIVRNREGINPLVYQEKMREFENEYKRQYLLAEIRTDGKEIFEKLERSNIRIEHERYNQTRARGIDYFVR